MVAVFEATTLRQRMSWKTIPPNRSLTPAFVTSAASPSPVYVTMDACVVAACDPMVESAPAVHASTAQVSSGQRREALSSQRRHVVDHAAQSQHPGGMASAAPSPLQRLQALADASPQVAQLMRLQALADSAGAGALQRKSPEEEELLQGRFRTAQLKSPEEDELLQGKFASSQDAPSQLHSATTPATPAPNRTGMPDGLKSGIEALSGLAMDHVRVHYNSDKPAQLNAHAYAQGSDIHLAPGQDRHLPHEAWHLVQQAQGRVQPTLQLNGGVAVNDDPSLEREADQMGERALASGG